jgi:putative flavoprotein involved in K+ transport
MAVERIQTLVIGGGQAGLAMSQMLKQRGHQHLVLERHRIAERWRSERWDGLRFQFPNWSVKLPDFPFPHTDPDAFAAREEIVAYLDAYAAFVAPPIRCGVEVRAQHRRDDGRGFIAQTSGGPIEAEQVVVATGPYQRGIIPDLLPAESGIFQVHANAYRAPAQLPPGAVLVVGSGASGAQIAEELQQAGRKVYLSVSHHRRMPRRYRGHDLIWWLSTLGLDQTTTEQRGPDRALPLITGADGGHTIDFRDFAARGVVLLGRAEAWQDGVLQLGGDIARDIAYGDATYLGFLDMVDAQVAERGMSVPADPQARQWRADPPGLATAPRRLDLAANGIASVIWSTGYGFDFSWLHIPVLADNGEPIHRHGITDVPGLYFLGLQWLSKMSSSFLSGIGDDAARLADHIVGMPARAAVTPPASPA